MQNQIQVHRLLINQGRVVGFIAPVSVLSVVVTSEYTASTSDRKSDIPSGINDLVSEACSVNKSTQDYE
jgi:hypothetical protein